MKPKELDLAAAVTSEVPCRIVATRLEVLTPRQLSDAEMHMLTTSLRTAFPAAGFLVRVES